MDIYLNSEIWWQKRVNERFDISCDDEAVIRHLDTHRHREHCAELIVWANKMANYVRIADTNRHNPQCVGGLRQGTWGNVEQQLCSCSIEAFTFPKIMNTQYVCTFFLEVRARTRTHMHADSLIYEIKINTISKGKYKHRASITYI